MSQSMILTHVRCFKARRVHAFLTTTSIDFSLGDLFWIMIVYMDVQASDFPVAGCAMQFDCFALLVHKRLAIIKYTNCEIDTSATEIEKYLVR